MTPLICIILCLTLFLQGCAGAERVTVTNPTTGETTVTETSGYSASENLQMFYTFEGKRVDTHASLTEKKLTMIADFGRELMANCTTTLEKALAAHNTQMQISSVATAPPPDGISQPKTMADYLDKNLVALLGTGVNAASLIWGTRANSSEASSSVITNSGEGSVFVNSTGISLQDYSLTANGDGGYISGLTFDNGLTYTPETTTTQTEGDTSNGLQLL
jgi:hypothetical protein